MMIYIWVTPKKTFSMEIIHRLEYPAQKKRILFPSIKLKKSKAIEKQK